jgi:hypothetical protein
VVAGSNPAAPTSQKMLEITEEYPSFMAHEEPPIGAEKPRLSDIYLTPTGGLSHT